MEKAGPTDADVPTRRDQLVAVSKKLTTDKVAEPRHRRRHRPPRRLRGPERRLVAQRRQHGRCRGRRQVTDALTFVQDNVKAGNFKMSNDLGAGWGGEAFGKAARGHDDRGNWIKGAMKNDYPKVGFKVVENARRGQKGTL